MAEDGVSWRAEWESVQREPIALGSVGNAENAQKALRRGADGLSEENPKCAKPTESERGWTQ